MEKKLSKIIGLGIVVSVFLVPVLFLKAEDASTTNREASVRNQQMRASTTVNRLENRQNNIDRIRERLASTTASTSEQRVNRLNNQLQKQEEQMIKVKDRLLNRETKIIDVLEKITDKITKRIGILTNKGLDMTAAKAKLALASTSIADMTTEAAKIETLLGTTITEANKDQLFVDIKTSQNKIKSLAKSAHALLVDTIKEITKVLPKNNATSTATSTND